MSTFVDMMEQDATYWAPGVSDVFGVLSFAAITPVAIKCRWQSDNSVFRDEKGNEVVANSVIYTSIPVLNQGWLVLGTAEAGNTGVDPAAIMGAAEIRLVTVSPSLQADEELYKAVV